MRLPIFLSLTAVLAGLSTAALAQGEGASERTLGTTADGKRIVSMVIYGDDPCPEGKDGEIVVCARQPERDRYRLPKQFRKPVKPGEPGWGARAGETADVGASGIGSCSAVGAGGATGCNRQMMRAARDARKAEKAEQEEVANEVDQQ